MRRLCCICLLGVVCSLLLPACLADASLYETLEVEPDATPEDIKDAYRRLSLLWHPDKNKDPEATKKFQEISHAHQVLSDEKKRAELGGQGMSMAVHNIASWGDLQRLWQEHRTQVYDWCIMVFYTRFYPWLQQSPAFASYAAYARDPKALVGAAHQAVSEVLVLLSVGTRWLLQWLIDSKYLPGADLRAWEQADLTLVGWLDRHLQTDTALPIKAAMLAAWLEAFALVGRVRRSWALLVIGGYMALLLYWPRLGLRNVPVELQEPLPACVLAGLHIPAVLFPLLLVSWLPVQLLQKLVAVPVALTTGVAVAIASCPWVFIAGPALFFFVNFITWNPMIGLPVVVFGIWFNPELQKRMYWLLITGLRLPAFYIAFLLFFCKSIWAGRAVEWKGHTTFSQAVSVAYKLTWQLPGWLAGLLTSWALLGVVSCLAIIPVSTVYIHASTVVADTNSAPGGDQPHQIGLASMARLAFFYISPALVCCLALKDVVLFGMWLWQLWGERSRGNADKEKSDGEEQKYEVLGADALRQKLAESGRKGRAARQR